VELFERTYPWRFAIGVTFFLVLGVQDWIRHREDPKRAKEYLFLLYAALVAIIYGVIHDEVTATISREYFIYGKQLDFDPPPFRVAVAILATRASYGVGLVAGALLLIANNPSPTRPKLGYRELMRLALLPLALAASGAVVGGALYAFDAFHLHARALELVPEHSVARFLVVWGVHTGSYAGAALGAIVSIVLVRLRRRARTAQSRDGSF
jgi:hypothetical protein